MTRPVRILLTVLVPFIGIIAVGYLYIASQPTWLHERAQEIIAHQLAQTINRQVRIGPVSGDLVNGITVAGVAIGRESGLDEGAVVSMEEISIDYDLLGILRRKKAPAAAVERVVVTGLLADVVRDEQGRVNLQELLPKPVKPTPPEAQFAGTVELRDSELLYTDRTDMFGREPLTVALTNIDGSVDLRRRGYLKGELSADGEAGRFEQIKADFGFNQGGPGFVVRADVATLNLPWARDRFLPQVDINITGGTASVSGAVYQPPEEDQPVGYRITADLNRVRGTIPPMDDTPVTVTGTATVTPQGVRTSDLTARAMNLRARITGGVMNFPDPVIDAMVEAHSASPGDLVRYIPDETAGQIPPIEFEGPLSLEGRITGALDHALVDAKIRSEAAVTVEPVEEVPVRAENLDLTVHLLDTSDPAVVAEANADRVVADAIPAAEIAGIEWPDSVTVSPMEDVSAKIQWAGGEPGIRTDLSVESVTAGEVQIGNISAGALLEGTVAQLKDIRLEALGGTLSADAMVNIDPESPAAYVEGEIDGMQASGLSAVPDEILDIPQSAAGRLDATFAGSQFDGQMRSAASVTASDLQYEDWNIRRAGLLARQVGREITLQAAYVDDPMLEAWADGTVTLGETPAESTMDLNYQVAGARLDEIARRFGQEDIAGEAYLSGTVGGDFGMPSGTGYLIIFRPRYGRYDAGAVVADLAVEENTLSVNELLATRQTLGLQLTGSLEGISGLGSELKETTMPISGTFELAGLDLRDVRQFLETDFEDLSGLAEARGTFGGTVDDPTASGRVHVVHALPGTVDITEGLLPFELGGDVLTVNGASISARGASLTADAALDFSNRDRPMLTANLSAADVHLEGLQIVEDYGIEAAGSVEIPVAHVSGPLDALTGELQVTGEDIQLDDEHLRDVRAQAALDGDIIRLQQMQADAASGSFGVTGTYNRSSKEIDAALHLDRTTIPGLLDLAGPLVRAATHESSTPQQQRQLTRRLNSMSLRIGGRLSADISVSGDIESPAAKADLHVTDGAFDQVPMPEMKLAANVDPRGIHGINLDASEGDALITAQGDVTFGDSVDLLVEASGVQIEKYRPLIGIDTAMQGRVDLTVMATGKPSSPDLKGSVDVLQPGMAGVQFDVINAPIVTLEEGELSIDTLVVKREEQEIVVDGTLPFTWSGPGLHPHESMDLQARAEDLDLDLIRVLLAEAVQHQAERMDAPAPDIWEKMHVVGSLNTTVNLTGTPQQPEIRGFLRLEDGLVQTTDDATPIEKIGLDADFVSAAGSNIMQLKKATATWDNTLVTGNGKAELNHLSVPLLHKNKYAFTFDVQAPEQELVRGWTAQDLGGTVELMTIQDDLQELSVNNLGGTFGTGAIKLDGNVKINDFRMNRLAHNQFDMALTAESARVNARGLLDALADGEIAVRGGGGAETADVTGAITLHDGRIGIPVSGGGAAGDMYALSSRYPSPDVNVRLKLGNNLAVRDKGIAAPLKPTDRAVHLHGTPQRPVVEGTVEAQTGRTQIPGGVANIRDLGVQYRLGPAMGAFARDPVRLDLGGNIWGMAQTTLDNVSLHGQRFARVDVEIRLTGRLPNKIEVSVSSDPPLDESQIYALLGAAPLGYLTGGTGAGGMGEVVSNQFAQALAAGFRATFFDPIETRLREVLGLETLRVSFAFDQPVEITLGEYVLDDLLVTYTTSAFAEDRQRYDLDISYEVGNKVRITYHTDEDDEDRLQIERTWTF